MINQPKVLRKCQQISWEESSQLSATLAKKIARSFQPDIIVGIARGGWVPARNLCDLLDVNDLVSIRIEHWGKKAIPSSRALIKYGLDADIKGKKILVVDDITDTGESVKTALAYLRQKEPKSLKCATLLHIKGCPFVPDFYAKDVKGWKWVIFPWNVMEDVERFVKELLASNRPLSSSEITIAFKRFYNLTQSKSDVEQTLQEIKRRGVIRRVGGKWTRESLRKVGAYQ